MSTPALFAPLERVVAKYRRDVHHLLPGASQEALLALEGHLGRSLPPGLRIFLGRHNGAQLFRGALRLRSTSDMALASDAAPQVVLFADSTDGDRWAWAQHEEHGFVFGRWDGTRLDGLHGTFEGWLRAQIALLDTRVRAPAELEALRLEADGEDVIQRVRAAERALLVGQPEEAEGWLREVTRTAPWNVGAWQRLGDALAASDRAAARQAWLRAFRQLTLPRPWPGAPVVEPDVVRRLEGAFRDVEEYERELSRFLEERVQDVATAEEAALVVAVARALAAVRGARGQRNEAREVLSDLLQRSRVFTHDATPWDALLELAALEVDLGYHDDAEGLLRRLRREGPADRQGSGLLLLARIAITRQEPWAEEILDEAEAAGLDDAERLELLCLRAERLCRQGRTAGVADHIAEARVIAQNLSDRRVQAMVALAEGDLARVRDDRRVAASQYERGLQWLEGVRDPDLRGRLHLRRGDIAIENRRVDAARQAYRSAAEIFAGAELPVREGWALLRLARLSDEPYRSRSLEAAMDRFTAADLAAGVAAVDAFRGTPGASLAWHLERATAHARARHDAQRPKPPWERADADRPERRLGAHRLAIAACAEPVVAVLAGQLDDCSRAIVAGRGRALDKPVVKYIAAADLLAAHRSYAAARVLLDHLLQRAVDGAAKRALQGAIARSPNAALVDGLLQTIESSEVPAPAVAEAAELLGLRREKAAVAALRRLAGPQANPIARKAAVIALGRIGEAGAIPQLLAALDEPKLAEAAALSLLLLGDRRGVDFHGRALAEGRRDLSGSPGEIVGRYGGPSHLLLLMKAAEGEGDTAMGAVHGLGLLGDPRCVPTLLRALSSRDRRVTQVANGALEILTGHAVEMDEPGGKNRWNRWVDENSGRFRDGVRYRAGKVFSPQLLIGRMASDEAWTRRTAYDELVITTGVALPFDSDGPWRVQQAHLRAWRRWWSQHKGRFQAGRWTLHGAVIG